MKRLYIYIIALSEEEVQSKSILITWEKIQINLQNNQINRILKIEGIT